MSELDSKALEAATDVALKYWSGIVHSVLWWQLHDTIEAAITAYLSALPAPATQARICDWHIERVDEDDGSITYEIWDHDPKHYRRVAKINDGDLGQPFAKRDAELIIASVTAPATQEVDELREAAMDSALAFIQSKLPTIAKEKGLVGLFCDAFRSGWASALRAPPELRGIKPLVWREYSRKHDYGHGSWEATGITGTYEILDVGEDGKNGNRYYLRGYSQFEALDDAKGFAQGDYEARVRPALAPADPQLHEDTARLDWLEMQSVKVPSNFWAFPPGGGTARPSDLRAQIDRARLAEVNKNG